MNTIKSVGYGWAFLIVAGGGSYFFAKRAINHERDLRVASERQRKQAELLAEENRIKQEKLAAERKALVDYENIMRYRGPNELDPSSAVHNDPAATRHAPTTEHELMTEKNKYEATQVFRAKKGDRLTGFR